MVSGFRWFPGLFAGLLLAGGCGDGKDTDGPGGGVDSSLTAAGDLAVPSITVDDDVIGVAIASFTASYGGTAHIEYGLDSLDTSTPEYAVTSGEDVTIALLGLKGDQSYSARLVLVEDGGENHSSGSTSFDSPALPEDLPEFELIVPGEDGSCGVSGFVSVGMMSFSPSKPSWALIMDRDGDVVWGRREEQATIMRLRPAADGESMLWSIADVSRTEDNGWLVRESMATGERSLTRLENHHHDFLQRPDGTIAWLSYDFGEYDYDEDGDLDDVASDIILEDTEGAQSNEGAAEVFNMFQDYEHGVWDNGSSEANAFIPGYYDFSHGNSLMMSEDGDHYYISFRWLDAIIKIERSSGEVLWQLGGDYDDFNLADDDAFSHTHMSEMWEGGALVFDNADETGRVSGAVEYSFDEESRTVEKVWEYRNEDGDFTSILGDAVRVSPDTCDEVLIAWSTRGRLQQLNRDYDTTWEIQTDLTGVVTGRVSVFDDIYTLR